MRKIKYSVILKTGALTGTDGVIGKDIDIPTRRDKDGFPYFPASHIKGILKGKISQMINTFSAFEDDKYSELIKNLFGEEGARGSGLRFSNLRLPSEERTKEMSQYLKDNLYSDSRHGIKINRKTKTTEDGSLFDYEFIRSGYRFEGEIEILDDLEKEEIKLLLATLFKVDQIGGMKSRGIGRVKVKIENANRHNLNSILEKISYKKTKRDLAVNNSYKKYKYTIVAQEDLILKSKEVGNDILTRDNIQGSTIRGAIIRYFVKNYGFDTKEINEYIIDKMKVTPAELKGKKFSFASFFRCKYSCKGKHTKIVNKLLSDKITCPDCGEKLKRMGVVYLDDNKVVNLDKLNTVGVEIENRSRTSKEGKLYNKEVLKMEDGKRTFEGEITLTRGMAKSLNKTDILIGKSKFKGFGKCNLKIKEIKKSQNSNMKNRISTLNNFLNLKGDKIFTIDLLSDLVLPFKSIYSVGEQLISLLGLDEFEVNFYPKKSFLNLDNMPGYNFINKTRKSDELIIKKGSVLTFRTPKIKDDLISRLKDIQDQGVGLRKDEGFGLNIVVSDYHMEVADV